MHIVIIGGGSAGFSCAAALSYNKNLSISLVEPHNIPTIGVGESTLPLINQFHKEFHLFEGVTWLKKLSATLKFTIDFENFLANKEQSWSHPFSINRSVEQSNVLENMHLSNPELSDKFYYTQRVKNSGFVEISPELAKIGAYHLDAKLYAQSLKEIALQRGVKLYNKRVVEIKQSDTTTEYLTLEGGERLNAELYIDCTGFKNILFEQLNAEFIPFTKRLFCDSAITLRAPYIKPEQQRINATLSHALNSGWVWHIPLQDSITMGYVFSSKHSSAKEAQEEFELYLQERYGYNTQELSFEELHFRSGTYKESWLGNNIAIGLSSFFIEPLESTGIALFEIQIMQLSKILQSNPKSLFNYRDSYNRDIRENIESVKEFIEMHYILSDRVDTPFWREASSIEPSATHKDILRLYKNREYQKILAYNIGGIFGNLSWLLLLIGMRKEAH